MKDPTLTGTLRKSFSRALVRGFDALAVSVLKFVGDQDALGLRTPPAPTMNAEGYEFANTQFNITDPLVLEDIQRIRSRIPDDVLLKVPTDPHVTVRYGLHPDDALPSKVGALVAGSGPAQIRINGVGVFDTPKGDVIKYNVDSRRLYQMNLALGVLPNTQNYDYSPHITIAYVKTGEGDKYTHLSQLPKGYDIWFDTLQVSDTMGNYTPLTINAGVWAHMNADEKVNLFGRWLKNEVLQKITNEQARADIQRHVAQAHALAITRVAGTRRLRAGTPANFTNDAAVLARNLASNPQVVAGVKTLITRTYTELEGVTQAMSTQMTRTLVDGLSKGWTATKISVELAKAVQGIGKERAKLIADTEIVRAYAEGQLDAMSALGERGVTANVEWTDSHDGKVCSLCKPLDGIVLTPQEARGMLPRHPRCRCAWKPAGPPRSDQVRGKRPVVAAIKRSIREEGGDPTDDTGWGPAKPIAPRRPTVNDALPLPPEVTPALEGMSEYLHNAGANCGIGSHGFAPGNTCARGGHGTAATATPAVKLPKPAPPSTKKTPAPKLSDKAARAKAAHVMVDKDIQRYAEEHNEPQFARMVGGKSYKNNEPVDVALEKDGKVQHGIELKTMVVNGNDKITMKRSAMEKKAEWERKNKADMHTIVIDDRKVYNGLGVGKHDQTKRRYFYRRGYGSFRVLGMLEAGSVAELKRLIATPDAKLPASAQRPKGQTRGKLA